MSYNRNKTKGRRKSFHNRNNKSTPDINRLHIIKTIDKFTSNLFFRNIEYKTKFVKRDYKKITTIITRYFISNEIQLTDNVDKNLNIVSDIIDKELLIELLTDYVNSHVFNEKQDYTQMVVVCSHLKDVVNEMFLLDITNEDIGLNEKQEVFCSCGELAIYDETPIVFKNGVKMEDENDEIDVDAFDIDENENADIESDDIEESGEELEENKSKPQLGATEEFKNKSFVYRTYTKYVCPKCGNWCYTHVGTNIPFGTPSNAETRRLRSIIHKEMTNLYYSRASRRMMYNLLAKELGIDVRDMHIGILDYDECRQAIKWIHEQKAIHKEIKSRKERKDAYDRLNNYTETNLGENNKN